MNLCYEEEEFIGAIAEAVKGVAGAAGKFAGKGKKGREAQALAGKQALQQKEIDAEMARVASKQAAKEAKAKTTRYIVIGVLSFLLIGLSIGGYFLFRKK